MKPTKFFLAGISVLEFTFFSPFGGIEGGCQDIHFSQFNAAPLTVNPAMTGVFSGDYRLILNYKNQWNGFTTGYKTFSTSIDGSFLRKKLKGDYIGLGIVAFSDKAGDSEFKTTFANISCSFNKALDRKNKQYMSVGVQTGFLSTGLNYSKLTWDSQWDPSTKTAGVAPFDVPPPAENTNNLDVSTGVLWYYFPTKKLSVTCGAALYHLTKPDVSFLSGNSVGLYRKMSVYLGGEYAISDYYRLFPSVLYMRQGPSREFNIGSYLKFIFSRRVEGEPSFFLGAWYRAGDAIIAAARFDYRHYSVAFSYDINISSLSAASKSQGGPEVSFITILPMPSRVRASRISCPGF